MRPELTTDETEIYEVYGRGNGYASYKQLGYSIRKTAALKSDAEGYDCFLLLDSEEETIQYTGSITTTQTMHGQSNTYSQANYSSNYYSYKGGYLGSSYGNISGNSNTNYSYQVPVTHNYTVSKPTSTWFVTFHEDRECRKLGKSKWRDRIYYNDATIRESAEYEKKLDKTDKIVVVSLIAGFGITLLILVSIISSETTDY
jgi:hypothetical protein